LTAPLSGALIKVLLVAGRGVAATAAAAAAHPHLTRM
jgi:hypothetical protein